MVSPVGAGRAVPPLSCDRPVRAHPEDVEVVGRPGHRCYGRTYLRGAGRRDRKGRWSPQLAPGAPSHHWVATAPSGPTQKTSRWLGIRATAARREPAWAAPGGVIAKGWWSPQSAPGAPSHHEIHRPVRAHPEDVEVVGRPGHRCYGRTWFSCIRARDREGLVVSPVGAGRAVPPLSCDRPVRAHPEDVEVVSRPRHHSHRRTWFSCIRGRDRKGPGLPS